MNAFPLRHWAKRGLTAWLLWPVAVLFGAIGAIRRLLYRLGVLPRARLPVPVVVIGNIHVGGVGKTPLVIELARALRRAGFRPGIVSRGYGRSARDTRCVGPDDEPRAVGDEPLLLHWAADCPVAVGRKRAVAGRLLLAEHPLVDVVLCDDGLQHYGLSRDIEICVLDGYRGWGNRWLLPAGPLREPIRRLKTVSALVVHGDRVALSDLPHESPCFSMRLRTGSIYPLRAPKDTLSAGALTEKSILAVAGIGDPNRFFDTLRSLGLDFESRAFADHHVYEADDLKTSADIILMTEKDAVKCRALDDGRIHVLPVSAQTQPDLGDWLIARLREIHGRQTA